MERGRGQRCLRAREGDGGRRGGDGDLTCGHRNKSEWSWCHHCASSRTAATTPGRPPPGPPSRPAPSAAALQGRKSRGPPPPEWATTKGSAHCPIVLTPAPASSTSCQGTLTRIHPPHTSRSPHAPPGYAPLLPAPTKGFILVIGAPARD